MSNKMQKTQGSSGMVKASDQKMDASTGGELETGKDLRQNPSGGAKAKGSM